VIVASHGPTGRVKNMSRNDMIEVIVKETTHTFRDVVRIEVRVGRSGSCVYFYDHNDYCVCVRSFFTKWGALRYVKKMVKKIKQLKRKE